MSDNKQIKNMTLTELRNELLNCDNNPVKSLIIQKIIKLRQLDKKYNMINNKKIELELEQTLNNIIEDKDKQQSKNAINIDVQSFYDVNEEKVNTMKEKNKIDTPIVDNKLNKDQMNNTLMARMNSDIDIRKIHKK
ncbi:MAG: hypothetical protein Edafosvirus26_12 [Edafosvirus sp.]|uniref:Uncharacterized protein n=1 Tax=Edafosvirus sp. TaxID=2487765 RepID=A0A3G4ZV21_9VIRU|nr:MAG: hypothetical protein Edafosvirus26_12 [Edafosvirus sp.]